MDNRNVLKVEKAEMKKNRIPKSKQSANVLFKFMKKIDYLEEIIKDKAIIPRYYEESIEYLKVDDIEKIVFPMVCFCDINLSKLDEHVKYYGRFGIALNKKWGIKKGVQCINYINPNSGVRKDFTYLFTKAYNYTMEDSSFDEYNNYLLGNLLFMKPIVGRMLRNNKYDRKNFTDEKEWRYVPKIIDDDKIQLIIPPIYIGNQNIYNTYSAGMKRLKHLWLTFNYDDIEYIMVSTKSDRNQLIHFILNDINIDCENVKKYELISKIIVYNIINKDW